MGAWVLCTYRVRKGEEDALLELMRGHERAVRKLSLVTDEPTRVFRGEDERGRPYFLKLFEWTGEEAVAKAHEHPEVLGVWERMEPLCEARDGRPGMEFPHLTPVPLD